MGQVNVVASPPQRMGYQDFQCFSIHFDSLICDAPPVALRIDNIDIKAPACCPLTELCFSRSSDGLWMVGIRSRE